MMKKKLIVMLIFLLAVFSGIAYKLATRPESSPSQPSSSAVVKKEPEKETVPTELPMIGFEEQKPAATETVPSENVAPEQKPADNKPSGADTQQKPAENVTEQKPEEQKPNETETQQKPDEQKPGEVVPENPGTSGSEPAGGEDTPSSSIDSNKPENYDPTKDVYVDEKGNIILPVVSLEDLKKNK